MYRVAGSGLWLLTVLYIIAYLRNTASRLVLNFAYVCLGITRRRCWIFDTQAQRASLRPNGNDLEIRNSPLKQFPENLMMCSTIKGWYLRGSSAGHRPFEESAERNCVTMNCANTTSSITPVPATHTLVVGRIGTQNVVQRCLALPLTMHEQEQCWERAVEVPHDGSFCHWIKVALQQLFVLSRILYLQISSTCTSITRTDRVQTFENGGQETVKA